MAEYVTKQDIVKSIRTEHMSVTSRLPRLAFDCDEQPIICEGCGSRDSIAFRYNSAAAAGSDAVVFEWEPDLYRILVRGYNCYDCDWHRIVFEYPVIEGSHRENNPDRIENVELGESEVVSSSQGN